MCGRPGSGQYNSLTCRISPLSADTLYDFFRYTCRYSEGKELFAGSAARLRDRPVNLPVPSCTRGRRAPGNARRGLCLPSRRTSGGGPVLSRGAGGGRRWPRQDDVAIAHTFVGFIAGWQGSSPTQSATCKQVSRTTNGLAIAATWRLCCTVCRTCTRTRDGFKRRSIVRSAASRSDMQLGRNDLLGNAHCELAFALKSLGYPKLALEHYRQGCSCSERSGDRLAYSMNVGGVGIELCQLGKKQWDQGFALIEQSLAICEELGHSVHIATRLYSLQQACIEGKRFVEAMPYAEELMRVATAIGFRRALTYCYLGMAESYLGLGDFTLCRQQLQLALRTCDGMEWNHPVLSHVVTYYALWLERGASAARRGSCQPVSYGGRYAGGGRLAVARLAGLSPQGGGADRTAAGPPGGGGASGGQGGSRTGDIGGAPGACRIIVSP